MTDNRLAQGLLRLFVAVMVWIGASGSAPGSAEAVTFETIQKFTSIAPSGQLLQASDGMLYGTGTAVFRVNPDGTAFEVLHVFSCPGGCPSGAGLTEGHDGKLYGTTPGGGTAGGGTVFRLNPDGTAFEILHSFACESDGCFPQGTLTAASDGKFYGTTFIGGVT